MLTQVLLARNGSTVSGTNRKSRYLVFKSFFGHESSALPDSSLDDADARVKRHVFGSMGAQVNCEPGFTGQFCESRKFCQLIK